MIFDELGLPKELGATDLQDSARLAGIITVFDVYRTFPDINLSHYFVTAPNGGRYVRHPREYIYDFSRDQAICLFAGLHFYNQRIRGMDYILEPIVSIDIKYVDGKDWFSPSHRGFVRACNKQKPNLLQKSWLWLDVLWACYVKPKAENNQLLCMLVVEETKKPLAFYVKHNKHWKQNVIDYWSGWRKEPELAQVIIRGVSTILSREYTSC